MVSSCLVIQWLIMADGLNEWLFNGNSNGPFMAKQWSWGWLRIVNNWDQQWLMARSMGDLALNKPSSDFTTQRVLDLPHIFKYGELILMHLPLVLYHLWTKNSCFVLVPRTTQYLRYGAFVVIMSLSLASGNSLLFTHVALQDVTLVETCCWSTLQLVAVGLRGMIETSRLKRVKFNTAEPFWSAAQAGGEAGIQWAWEDHGIGVGPTTCPKQQLYHRGVAMNSEERASHHARSSCCRRLFF